jgi:hypothetical protein
MEPLWSALNFAQRCGMAVVISDNSGDAEKRAYFENGPSHLTYLANGPAGAATNVMAALSAVDTEFVLILGDDDYIDLADGAAPYDFSTLAADVIGVKPRIELVSANRQRVSVNDFSIDETDAATRVLEYTRKMRGGNSSYYSFFRTRQIAAIHGLFAAHHPTRIGNADFPIVFALVAAGRIVHDPATTIRYDNSRWEDVETASAAILDLFAEAGMPAEARSYMLLLHFLDSYVLMLREDAGMEPIDRYKSAYAVIMVFLRKFLMRVAETPQDYELVADLTPPLGQEVEKADPDLDRIFHIAGLMADRLKPGLKERYDGYLLAAVRGTPAPEQQLQD